MNIKIELTEKELEEIFNIASFTVKDLDDMFNKKNMNFQTRRQINEEYLKKMLKND